MSKQDDQPASTVGYEPDDPRSVATTDVPPIRVGIASGVDRPRLVLGFLAVAQFMVFLDVSIVNVALPSIESALHISEANLPYVVTLYGTALGGFLLFGSRLADTFGRRRMLQIGLAIFGIASLLAGLTQTQELLFAARALQGLGSALIAPAALSILTTTFTGGAERAKALGLWGGLTGLASVAGVILGGVLSDGPGWRWIFFINVPIAVATVLAAPRVLPESRGGRRRFDLAGAALLTSALLVLLRAFEEAIDRGWTDPVIAGELLLATILLAVFALVERRVNAPLVPFDVFRLATLRVANIATLFLLGTVVTVFFFASLFMQQVLGFSAMEAGLAYAPLAVIVAIGAGLATGLVARIPGNVVLIAGLALLASGVVLLARMPSDASYLTHCCRCSWRSGGHGPVLRAAPDCSASRRSRGAGQPGRRADQHQPGLGGALGVAIAATYAFRRVNELTASSGSDPGPGDRRPHRRLPRRLHGRGRTGDHGAAHLPGPHAPHPTHR